MRVIDTSAWIEWLIGSSVGSRIEAALPARDAWIVPTIVQLELAKWLVREFDEEKADQVIAFTERCVVVDLDSRLALVAADLSARHRLAVADAIIYATARISDADLVTCDRHFEGLPGVTLVTKDQV